MIDLHAHTDRSDGVLSPCELVDRAKQVGLRALAITDHDTVAGCDDAVQHARRLGLELIYGVELSSKFRGRTVHLLGYFLEGPPDETFRRRLVCLAKSRRERNERLAARLRELGCDVTLEEAEAIGKGQTGRPHFARLLVRKGYVPSYREAFNKYLDDGAKGFVDRKEPSLENVFSWIRESGGIPSWAHPGRFVKTVPGSLEEMLGELAEKGMLAVECYHRDHTFAEAERFRAAAQKLNLGVTGGSDFHGPSLDGVPLGGLNLPDSLLEDLEALSRSLSWR